MSVWRVAILTDAFYDFPRYHQTNGHFCLPSNFTNHLRQVFTIEGVRKSGIGIKVHFNWTSIILKDCTPYSNLWLCVLCTEYNLSLFIYDLLNNAVRSSKDVSRRIIGLVVSNELDGIWKNALVGYVDVLSQHIRGQTKEIDWNLREDSPSLDRSLIRGLR
jgi:hypothetical protein